MEEKPFEKATDAPVPGYGLEEAVIDTNAAIQRLAEVVAQAVSANAIGGRDGHA